MGITENYRMIKTPCRICDESGIVLVPEGENVADVIEWSFQILAGTNLIEEQCPVCDGRGWYNIERED